MKTALIQYKGKDAGILKETDEGYEFQYNEGYLSDTASKPVSLTLPLTDKPFKSSVLFPFFDGLIPEGWLLDVALRNTDISELDRFSLLLLCCKDCIGAVSVIPLKEDSNE
ncbi:MAG: HipA N-terminal domain-containing protein [Bacteroidaceae bacterium]|jgi:serine/threonine-protein kinase HipA|nr:HipA N-terminal domain-containing protein [Bacteroidaceae bacterium]MBO7618647.1 HipA N-terminal domain-containing protein [Bacteroidales bacterium]MBR3937404.1 HipA N-terminal domain-containing protein [Bacteroidaceae bacterium]MBR5945406.1 HipA N-terminal domain-containing protein [Lachnospiraceae bacterium]